MRSFTGVNITNLCEKQAFRTNYGYWVILARMKKVAVVILCWNGRKYLEEFLPSVIENSPADLCDIVVADNASTDDSVLFLRQNFPGVHIIENAHNEGFASGYNTALRQVEAKYFVLLNQDV